MLSKIFSNATSWKNQNPRQNYELIELDDVICNSPEVFKCESIIK